MNSSLQLAECKNSNLYRKFERVKWALRDDVLALYSEEVNSRLINQDISVQIGDPFDVYRVNGLDIDKEIFKYIIDQFQKQDKIIKNDPKVRLASDLTERTFDQNGSVLLERTDYFNGQCTNEIVNKKIMKVGKCLIDGKTLLVNLGGTLFDLDSSPCSNHIGISTLAFTPTGHLIITRQAAQAAQSSRFLAPTGSGSADWKDTKSLKEKCTLQKFVKTAVRRELLEECGLKRIFELHPRITTPTEVMGYARLLHRGGKPDFYCVTVFNASPEELRISLSEKAFIDGHDTSLQVPLDRPSKIINCIKEYEEDNKDRISFVLQLNFLFLKQYLKKHPDYFKTLVKSLGYNT